jgi:hypothetical protein
MDYLWIWIMMKKLRGNGNPGRQKGGEVVERQRGLKIIKVKTSWDDSHC